MTNQIEENKTLKSFNGTFTTSPSVNVSVTLEQTDDGSSDIALLTIATGSQEHEYTTPIIHAVPKTAIADLKVEISGFDKFIETTPDDYKEPIALVTGTVMLRLNGEAHKITPVYAFPMVDNEPDVDIDDVTFEVARIWRQVPIFAKASLRGVSAHSKSQITQEQTDLPTAATHGVMNGEMMQSASSKKLSVKEFFEILPTKLLVGGSVLLSVLTTLIVVMVFQSLFGSAHASPKAKSSATATQTSHISTPEHLVSNGHGTVNSDAMARVTHDTTMQMLQEMGIDPSAPSQDLGCLVH
ncbi:hypothetical protein B0181_04825 [Moraxella caviae]|uniref:Uncharacterized protein n=1 Tax=Moraxella caviae TaxID=34060 RepID=A0A1T0A341_9GAMM|nr:hypothetical protein [Moraxella caviae]OOR90202.1 hypothetical protein B0181_04825 [Moraxella caviae]STZ14580.1 Uncharacterised protein [Moraxella caviae]